MHRGAYGSQDCPLAASSNGHLHGHGTATSATGAEGFVALDILEPSSV